jgi:formylglycine-generating enzyme required for sulfatase activity
MHIVLPKTSVVAFPSRTEALAAVMPDAVVDADATYLALRATGMDAFEAIAPVAQGDRMVAAHLWLEALRLVEIPAGTFLMGSPKTDPNHQGDEGPQRQVTIDRPFQMSAVQASQGAWAALMGNNPSHFQGDPALPVEQVSWQDICGPNGFLDRLNALTEGVRPEGTVFRLPSEAEWEYTCRAGTTTAYSFGDDPAAMVDHGWTSDNAGGKTHPVGQKQPNAFGLHDLHGNVWEWCEDAWHDTYKGAPKDGSAWTKGGEAVRRVLRGGSWYGHTGGARSAYRDGIDATYWSLNVGFRVVCVPARTS